MTSKPGGNLGISREAYDSIKKTLASLPTGLRPLFDAYDSHWEPGSLADKEVASFPGTEAVASAFSQAFIAITVAGEHIAALDRVLSEPVMTFAPWTALRMVLEASATALWLLDKDISANERVTRSMALRYEHIQDALRFLRDDPKYPEDIQAIILALEQRLLDIENTAKVRKINLKHDRKQRVVGVGNGVPRVVDLCRLTLGEGWKYRLLSGVAHGRSWAQLTLGFRRVEGVKALTQHLDPLNAVGVMVDAITWFSRAVWAYFYLAGWDLERLKSILEGQYDQAHLAAKTRIWRTLEAR